MNIRATRQMYEVFVSPLWHISVELDVTDSYVIGVVIHITIGNVAIVSVFVTRCLLVVSTVLIPRQFVFSKAIAHFEVFFSFI